MYSQVIYTPVQFVVSPLYYYGNDGADDQIHGISLTYNFIEGYGGNDWLYGNIGGDVLLGDSGNDALYGGGGSDWLWAAPTKIGCRAMPATTT